MPFANPADRTAYEIQRNLREPGRSTASVKILWARRRKILQDIKMERGCADCGFRGHPDALEFDHVRGEKLFQLGTAWGRPAEVVEAEIAKCDVVCSNCHHIRTAQRRSK